MSLVELTPTLVFEFGRSAVYLMALVFGFLLHSKGRTPGLLCMFGGLLAVYAMRSAVHVRRAAGRVRHARLAGDL